MEKERVKKSSNDFLIKHISSIKGMEGLSHSIITEKIAFGSEKLPPLKDDTDPYTLMQSLCLLCGMIDIRMDDILICEHCDKEFHITCITPPLIEIPKDHWYCEVCFELKEKESDNKLKHRKVIPRHSRRQRYLRVSSSDAMCTNGKTKNEHIIYLKEHLSISQLKKCKGYCHNSYHIGHINKLAKNLDYWKCKLCTGLTLLENAAVIDPLLIGDNMDVNEAKEILIQQIHSKRSRRWLLSNGFEAPKLKERFLSRIEKSQSRHRNRTKLLFNRETYNYRYELLGCKVLVYFPELKLWLHGRLAHYDPASDEYFLILKDTKKKEESVAGFWFQFSTTMCLIAFFPSFKGDNSPVQYSTGNTMETAEEIFICPSMMLDLDFPNYEEFRNLCLNSFYLQIFNRRDHTRHLHFQWIRKASLFRVTTNISESFLISTLAKVDEIQTCRMEGLANLQKELESSRCTIENFMSMSYEELSMCVTFSNVANVSLPLETESKVNYVAEDQTCFQCSQKLFGFPFPTDQHALCYNQGKFVNCTNCGDSFHDYCAYIKCNYASSVLRRILDQKDFRTLHIFYTSMARSPVSLEYICKKCRQCDNCQQKGKHLDVFQISKLRCVRICNECQEKFMKNQYCIGCCTTFDMHESELSMKNMRLCDDCHGWVAADCDETKEISPYFCPECRKHKLLGLLNEIGLLDKAHMFYNYQVLNSENEKSFHEIVKLPLDFCTVFHKLLSSEYCTSQTLFESQAQKFRNDIELIFLNGMRWLLFANFVGKDRLLKEVWELYNSVCEVLDLTSIEFLRLQSNCEENQTTMVSVYTHEGIYDHIIRKEFHSIIRRETEEQQALDQYQKQLSVYTGPSSFLSENATPGTPRSPRQTKENYITFSYIDARTLCWMDMCRICHSSGFSSELICCVDCGECYHTFCVRTKTRKEFYENPRQWRCINCGLCEICGEYNEDEEARTLICDLCEKTFHMFCLSPEITSVPEGNFFCGACVKCEVCHINPGLPYYSERNDVCTDCDPTEKDYIVKGNCKSLELKTVLEDKICQIKRKQNMDGCLACLVPWIDADETAVQCDMCDLWIHPACDLMSMDDFQNLTDSNSKYYCPLCRLNQSHLLLTGNLACNDEETVDTTLIHLLKNIRKVQIGRRRLAQLWTDKVLCKKAKVREEYCEKNRHQILNFEERFQSYLLERGAFFKVYQESIQKQRSIRQRAARYYRSQVSQIGHVRKLRLLQSANGAGASKQSNIITRLKSAICFQTCLWSSNPSPIPTNVVFPVTLDEHAKIFPKNLTTALTCEPEFDQSLGYKKELSVLKTYQSNDLTTSIPSLSLCIPLRGWKERNIATKEFMDHRRCALCHRAERAADGSELCGRLLYVNKRLWIHSLCVSSFCTETGNKVDDFNQLKSVLRQRCRTCSRLGAGVKCTIQRCSNFYHYPCAIETCVSILGKEEGAVCASHNGACGIDSSSKTKMEPKQDLKYSLTLGRYGLNVDEGLLPLDSNTVGNGRNKTEPWTAKAECYRIGALTVHSIGYISSQFPCYDAEHLYPLCFRSSRIYWSCTKRYRRCLYVFEIQKCVDANKKPCLDFSLCLSDDEHNPIHAKCPNDLLEKLRRRLLLLYREDKSSPFRSRRSFITYGLTAPHFFGFGLPSVVELIEKQAENVASAGFPGIDGSKRYLFKYSLPSNEAVFKVLQEKSTSDMNVDAQDCSRVKEWKNTLRQQSKTRSPSCFHGNSKNDVGSNTQCLLSIAKIPITQQYRELQTRVNDFIEIRSSGIHGYGAFARLPIEPGQLIVEYQGEIVNQKLADEREKTYTDSGLASFYMFRIDSDKIIDATLKGNIARFLNHSCNPNAYATVIETPEKKVVIVARKHIELDEEVVYDYNISDEKDEVVSCCCGSANCRGKMV